MPLHFDVSWFLLVGHRFLHGAVLGVEVVEINPPLFAYLSVPGGLGKGAAPGGPLGTSLAIVAAGSLGAAVTQAKGWENHYLPAAGFAALLFLVLSIQQSEGGTRFRLRSLAARVGGGVAGVLVVMQTIFLLSGGSGELESVPNLRTWLQEHTNPGDTIAVLTGVPFTPVRLAESTRTVLATRFQNLWPLASLRSSARNQGAPQLAHPEATVEKYLFTAIVSDLSREQPAVIAVRPTGGELPSLDLVEYFMRSPIFHHLIASYDSIGSMDHYIVRRRPKME